MMCPPFKFSSYTPLGERMVCLFYVKQPRFSSNSSNVFCFCGKNNIVASFSSILVVVNYSTDRPVCAVVTDIAVSAEVWSRIPGSVKSDTALSTARHRCDVASELCRPGAKPPR